MKKYQLINSVARAAEILKCLSTGTSKVTDIARDLQIDKTTVHRILKTLEIKKLVVREPVSRQYFLGPAIQTIASNPLTTHNILIQSAIREMKYLKDACKETVVLQINRGGQRMILEIVAGNENIRFFPDSLDTAPIHTGACGRILLAGLEDEQLEKLLPRLNLERKTSKTISNIDKLRSEIEIARKNGYAISAGENVKDAMAIAVPITNYTYPVAMAVIGPELRMRQKEKMILEKLKKSGKVVSKKIANLLMDVEAI